MSLARVMSFMASTRSVAPEVLSHPCDINLFLGDDAYLARSTGPTPALAFARSSGLPVTVFQVTKNQTVNAQVLQTWRVDNLDADDVFRVEFLQNIVFGGVREHDIHLTADARRILAQWQTASISFEPLATVHSGPYFAYQKQLLAAWKVYEDRQLAFVASIWPSARQDGSFEEVQAPGSGYRSHGIAVRARSYSKMFSSNAHTETCSSRPLQGMRIAVKDNFHTKGTRTSLCNRAYYETYPSQKESADVVTLLIAAGAEIVGKTYMSCFAMMEHPTQSVDFQAAWNPRADGYQITGGSSGGSSAAIAAYDWVDLAIASDTTGSSRIPALQTGVFAFRPSTHAISTKGLLEAWPQVDTPAWFGRDLSYFPPVFECLQSSGLSKLKSTPEVRTLRNKIEVIYPQDFVPKENKEQAQELGHFFADLGRHAAYSHRQVSLADDWRTTAPVEEKDLQKYLYHITDHGWYYAAYHTFANFRKVYEQANGFPPFVSEVVRWYWSLGSKVTDQQHEEMMRRFSVFKDWFLEQYMSSDSHDTIVLFPVDTVKPKYRDEYPGNGNPTVPGLRTTFISPMLEAPEVTIPIAQVPYQSRITKNEEMLPVVAALMGPPGTDLALLNWSLEALRKSKRSTTVKSGKVAFETISGSKEEQTVGGSAPS